VEKSPRIKPRRLRTICGRAERRTRHSHSKSHLFLSLCARMFQKVVSAPLCAPRPTAPALEKTRRPSPASMLLKSVPYGAALDQKVTGCRYGHAPTCKGDMRQLSAHLTTDPRSRAPINTNRCMFAMLRVRPGHQPQGASASIAFGTIRHALSLPAHAV
jgi:hypothetical protein